MTATTRRTPAQRTTYHRDGTVTYWSVMQQSWQRRTGYISDADLAAMPPAERQRIVRHLDRADKD